MPSTYIVGTIFHHTLIFFLFTLIIIPTTHALILESIYHASRYCFNYLTTSLAHITTTLPTHFTTTSHTHLITTTPYTYHTTTPSPHFTTTPHTTTLNTHSLLLPYHHMDYFIMTTLIILLLFLLKRLHAFFFILFNRTKQLGEVGYPQGTLDKGAVSLTALMRRRCIGDVPPVYPNGWFAVLESRDLAVKTAVSTFCLGKNLAVFRGEDGVARVIDAYCPHNGANMGVGGVVNGNCLECPFHGWRFQGDGKCVHVPYCLDKHIPEQARVTSYEALEQNGFILIWHHAEGEKSTWQPPEVTEVETKVWKYAGRSEHIVNAHIEEIPENGADIAHLSQVHGPVMVSGSDLCGMRDWWWSFSHHQWNGCWNKDPIQKHVAQMNLQHRLVVAGHFVPLLDLEIVALQIGPGLVHLLFESALIGKGAYIQTLTPVEPLLQRVVHHIYVQKLVPNFIAKFFIYGEALMLERDLMIWNNKKYVKKPVWVKSKEDSLLARHRRWYSQFYSANSPRLDTKTMLLNDW